MSNQSFDEKNEKELRKREEKTAEEKSFDEKYRSDPLSGVVWASILIWAGSVFLANNLGYLTSITRRLSDRPTPFPFLFETWPIIFFGAGIILLLEILVRYLLPVYRQPVVGRFILAVVFLSIGINRAELIFPLILIALGASILLRGAFRSRK